MKVDFAERARALVGTRFRLQGRTCDGLDCVGVVLATFGLDPKGFRRDYSLRSNDAAEAKRSLAAQFRRVSLHQLRDGDVMLMKVADDQLHLGIRTRRGFVHAHAGIGRVVETPELPGWPLLAVYRKRRSR